MAWMTGTHSEMRHIANAPPRSRGIYLRILVSLLAARFAAADAILETANKSDL